MARLNRIERGPVRPRKGRYAFLHGQAQPEFDPIAPLSAALEITEFPSRLRKNPSRREARVFRVHSSLRSNTRVIGWMFTTNRYHIGHHSIVFEQSNTNYGCSAIIWDRVFGTFGSDSVVEAGIGPREPPLSQKLMMPFRGPADSAISPMTVRSS